jgi:F-type H+-transporting ATPase subunit gamma
MSREATLEHHVRSMEILDEAILAMKSLSALHFRLARHALLSARAYRHGLESAVSSLSWYGSTQRGGTGVLVLGADLGLCAGYHSRLVEAAQDVARKLSPMRVDCAGRRTAALLVRSGLAPRRVYASPTSVENVGTALLPIVADLLAAFGSGAIGAVHVVSAKFAGIGEFQAVPTQLLPLEVLSGGGPARSRYVTEEHLREVAARERLFARLEELVLDAIASEHGMRLVATSGAQDWLDRELERARRRVRALRQESSTQEILELASGARKRRAR